MPKQHKWDRKISILIHKYFSILAVTIARNLLATMYGCLNFNTTGLIKIYQKVSSCEMHKGSHNHLTFIAFIGKSIYGFPGERKKFLGRLRNGKGAFYGQLRSREKKLLNVAHPISIYGNFLHDLARKNTQLFQGSSGLAKRVFHFAAQIVKDKYLNCRHKSSILDL